jgi:CheY-like chemotaxis protein
LLENLSAANLEQYLTAAAVWSGSWRARGAGFADTLELLSAWRRTMLPFLVREYPAGPELEIVFRALDSLERALVSVFAAAEISSLQEELARASREQGPKAAAPLNAPAQAGQATILVVDDEPMVLDVAARSFEVKGFQTATAGSGAAAVRLYKEKGPFDVVILDLAMPNMNGLETARAIRQLDSRAVLLLMTGWATEPDAAQLEEAGVNRTIAKPFEVEQVIQLLRESQHVQSSE